MDTEKRSYPNLNQTFTLMLALFGIGMAMAMLHGLGLQLLPPALQGSETVRSAAELVGYTLWIGLTIWVGLRRRRGLEAGQPSLRFARVPVSILAIGGLMFLALGVALEPVVALLPMPESIQKLMAESVRPNVFSFVSVVVMAPLLEEVLMRGIVLEGLLKNYKPSTAILASAFWFSAMHMNPWQGLPAFMGGLLLGWVYWRTRSLLPCILMHALNNLVAFVLCVFVDVNASFTDLMGDTTYAVLLVGAVAVLAAGAWWLAKRMGGAATAYSS
jgi:hypothetical protein